MSKLVLAREVPEAGDEKQVGRTRTKSGTNKHARGFGMSCLCRKKQKRIEKLQAKKVPALHSYGCWLSTW